MQGGGEHQGRRIYQIAFEPVKKELCVQIGGDHEGDCDSSWKGEAWIDAEELQPVRIQTDLAFPIPWGVRVFLGTNLRQTGFSITYRRVAENVWFPATYGTEFRFDVLWAYKRTVALSLESDSFRKTDASSTIKVQGEAGEAGAKKAAAEGQEGDGLLRTEGAGAQSPLGEAADCLRFVVVDFEDGVELGDLQ